MPSDTEWAYLAGFIDGEGTLTITRHTRKDRPGYMRFNLRVAAYNTNIELLKKLQSVFGGLILVAERKNPHYKPQGQLTWSEAQIVEILLGIEPYLKLKTSQAAILLSMQATKMNATKGRRNGLSPEDLEAREIAYQTLKTLNRRGVHALSIS